MATVKDALEILGYAIAEKIEPEIFGITEKSKRKNNMQQNRTVLNIEKALTKVFR